MHGKGILTSQFRHLVPLAFCLLACAESDPNQLGPGECRDTTDCLRGQSCEDRRCETRSADAKPPDPDGDFDRDGPAPADTATDAAAPADTATDGAAPADTAADGAAPADALLGCDPGTVLSCGSNVGTCRPGRSVCQDDGTFGPCEDGVEPKDEACDGADDDCDGVVDNGFDLGRACDGACGPGESECGQDGLPICSSDEGGSEYGIEDELCNGDDDDCDGEVDEDFNLGEPCDGTGACGEGVNECDDDGGLRCSTDPGGSTSEAIDETCNGRDDDCDGTTDEGFGIGQVCNGGGECGQGLFECNGAAGDGGVRCSTAPGGSDDRSSAEACDGLDNDCNGAVDDNRACGGETCMNALGVLLASTVSGDTTDLASDQDDPLCAGETDGPDQVFRFDPSPNQGYVVGLAPLVADYDPALWITRDCPGPRGGCVLYQDQYGAGRPEADLFSIAQVGPLYAIIDSFAAPGGPFVLSVYPEEAGETCDTAIDLDIPARFAGTTARFANDSAGLNCPAAAGQTIGRDQFFRLNIAARGTFVATVLPGRLDGRPVVYLLDDCGVVDETCVAGAVANQGEQVELSVPNIQPGLYYLGVDHDDANNGPFFLEVRMLP